MIVKFAYGTDDLPLDLREFQVRHLRPTAPASRGRVEDLVRAALAEPLDGIAWEQRIHSGERAAVVVPDTTRKLAIDQVLPVVIDRLEATGFESGRIAIVIANGTHPQSDGSEVRRVLGDAAEGLEVVQHDSHDDRALQTVGRTSAGNRIRLNRRVVESDVVITIGAVKHHYFAGFGGGPKMIFPGVAGYSEIQRNHSRVVQQCGESLQRSPGCEPGVLRQNPVAEEIAEAADLLQPQLALCVVTDSEGLPTWVGCGSWRVAFDQAVERCRQWYEAPGEEVRLAIVAGGGAPADSTLIQAHKAFDAGCRFLAAGGEILYLAEIGLGAGSAAMMPFLEDPDPENILRALAQDWIQYGHTTLRLVEKTRRYRAHLVSQLDAVLARRLGFAPVCDPNSVLDRWRAEYPRETVAVMPAATVFPQAR